MEQDIICKMEMEKFLENYQRLTNIEAWTQINKDRFLGLHSTMEMNGKTKVMRSMIGLEIKNHTRLNQNI